MFIAVLWLGIYLHVKWSLTEMEQNISYLFLSHSAQITVWVLLAGLSSQHEICFDTVV